MPERRAGPLRALLFLAAAVLLLTPSRAAAFPFFITHGYTNCAQCHLDPSGAGALTAYGRAQAQILLATQYRPMEEEPGKSADFLYGVLPLPVPLTLQADVRSLVIPEPGNFRFVLMQADLRVGVQAGPFIAYGSLGTTDEGAEEARITSNDTGWNLISREYWLGVAPAKGWLIRAGRMNLPFGIRTEDHVLYTRAATRTTTNTDQQVGGAVLYNGKAIRTELMGIAGNFQVSPDAFRERGYSWYGAWGVTKTLELGASSLVTHADADVETALPRTRQAHGLFVRAAPIRRFPLAILAEGDVLLDRSEDVGRTGLTTTGVVDYEPVQGLRVQGIGQFCDPSFSDDGSAYSVGGAVQWFFFPRFDIRADAFYGNLRCTEGVAPQPLGLVQGHFFL